MDTDASGSDAHARLEWAGTEIVMGVQRTLPAWVEAQVEFIAEAWGRLSPSARKRLREEAHAAGAGAAARVTEALRELFATPPREQRTTPLAIVRSATGEVTAVLARAGIPPVERDEFHERVFADDLYGVTPSTLGDLGDEELGPLQFAWGMAKANVLRGESGVGPG